MQRFAKIKKIKYPVLADPKSEIIRAFGLVNENYAPGSYAHGVAWPIILVIAPGGTVTHRFSHINHHVRPNVDAVLKEIQKAG